jgi:hypothetical protein
MGNGKERERHAVIPPKKWSIRVGTVVGKMTTTKQHTAPEGEEHKKDKSEKKSPLLPTYSDVPGDLRRHMNKSARLANI